MKYYITIILSLFLVSCGGQVKNIPTDNKESTEKEVVATQKENKKVVEEKEDREKEEQCERYYAFKGYEGDSEFLGDTINGPLYIKLIFPGVCTKQLQIGTEETKLLSWKNIQSFPVKYKDYDITFHNFIDNNIGTDGIFSSGKNVGNLYKETLERDNITIKMIGGRFVDYIYSDTEYGEYTTKETGKFVLDITVDLKDRTTNNGSRSFYFHIEINDIPSKEKLEEVFNEMKIVLQKMEIIGGVPIGTILDSFSEEEKEINFIYNHYYLLDRESYNLDKNYRKAYNNYLHPKAKSVDQLKSWYDDIMGIKVKNIQKIGEHKYSYDVEMKERIPGNMYLNTIIYHTETVLKQVDSNIKIESYSSKKVK